MKTRILLKILLLFFLLFFVKITNAQITEQWLIEYNGPDNLETYGHAIIVDDNDNILIAGNTLTTSSGFNYFIRKYTSTGDTLWTTIYDYPGKDVGFQIKSFILDSNENIYLLGTIGWDTLQDILTLKFDSNGVYLWSAVYNGTDNLADVPQTMSVDNNGNVYLAADIGGWDQGLNKRKFWGFIKYNSSGVKQWEQIIGYNGDWYENSSPRDFEIDENGNIYVTGIRSSRYIAYQGVMTIKYDPSGNEQWRHEYNGQNGNSGLYSLDGNKLLITPNNNIFMANGFRDTYGTFPNDTAYSYLLTVLYDPNGNILLQTVDSTECNFKPQIMGIGQDGNIYLIGQNSGGGGSYSTPPCYPDTTFSLIKYDLSGNQILKLVTPVNSNIVIYDNNDNIIETDSIYNIYAAGSAYAQTNNGASYSQWPVVFKINTFGNMDWLAEYNRGYGEALNVEMALDSKGNVYTVGYSYEAGYTNSSSFLLKYCPACNNLISGKVYREKNGDCIQDTAAGEKGLNQWMVKLDPLSLYTMTDSNGYYSFYVDSGNYVVTQIISEPLLNKKCFSTPDSYQITVLPGSTNTGYDFADTVAVYCFHPEVDLTSGALRPCMNTLFSVNYCNTGTASVNSVYIEVEFDTIFTPVSSTLPWSSQGNNIYTFDIGTLQAGQCGSFLVNALVSCYATHGSTHCTEARIFPDTLCFPNDSTWDHSSVAVEGECVNDSLACFTIYNTGDPGAGDMQGPSDYRIYENNVLIYTGQFQIAGGDSLLICRPTNGNAIRLEADQVPGHPGHSHPQETVEDCGDSTGNSLGQIILIPEDDMDDNVEIDCKEITGSWDPNEKWVKPVGLTQNHYIDSTEVLEYQINFQNTGTDTAFTIIIRDTLSQYLDAATIVMGASSHSYTFKIYGQGILEWRFDHVLLPDSNSNEPASHGFVKFKVNQSPGNSQETLIENKAGIIFDYNSPVITDVVWNVVNDTVIVAAVKPEIFINTIDVNVFPNPFNDYTTFVITGMNKSEQYSLILYDLMGKEMKRINNISSNIFEFRKSNLPAGMYFYTLYSKKETIATGKIIIN